MAINRQQYSIISTVGSTVTSTFTASSAAGSLLVATFSGESGAPTFPAGWTQAVAGALLNLSIWYYPNAPATTNVPVTQTTSATIMLWVGEYRGVATSPTVLSLANASSTTTSPITCGPISPTSTAAVVAVFVNDSANDFTSPTGGFSTVVQQQVGGTNEQIILDQISSAGGTYTAGVSFASETAAGAIASFAGAGTVTVASSQPAAFLISM